MAQDGDVIIKQFSVAGSSSTTLYADAGEVWKVEYTYAYGSSSGSPINDSVYISYLTGTESNYSNAVQSSHSDMPLVGGLGDTDQSYPSALQPFYITDSIGLFIGASNASEVQIQFVKVCDEKSSPDVGDVVVHRKTFSTDEIYQWQADSGQTWKLCFAFAKYSTNGSPANGELYIAPWTGVHGGENHGLSGPGGNMPPIGSVSGQGAVSKPFYMTDTEGAYVANNDFDNQIDVFLCAVRVN